MNTDSEQSPPRLNDEELARTRAKARNAKELADYFQAEYRQWAELIAHEEKQREMEGK